MQKFGYRTLTAITALVLMPTASHAQNEDYEAIVTIMRACSVIEDLVARVTCYDNNIAPGERASVSAAGVQPNSPPAAASPRQAEGFGANMVASTRERARAEQTDEVEMQVSGSRMLEPGIYLVTMSDGAQWRFSDSAPGIYEPPRAGDTVRLKHGALGSVFMHFEGQEGLRVRRVH